MIGRFEAIIKDYGIGETQAGRPQVYVMFEFEFEDEDGKLSKRTMSWFGSLYRGAVEITLKSLLHCGLREENFAKLGELVKGPKSKLLDQERPRVIDIIEEPHHEDMSKTVTKVAWVNDPLLGPSVKKMDEAKANSFFGENKGVFADELKRLAAGMNFEKPKEKEEKTVVPEVKPSDIPF